MSLKKNPGLADLLLNVIMILIEQILILFQVFTYSLHKKVETDGKNCEKPSKTALKSVRTEYSLLSVNDWTKIDRLT